MTPLGYRLLLCLLGVFLVSGAIAAAPSALELGLVPTVSCEAWWRHPESSGAVRLEGCVVDAVEHTYLSGDDDHVDVALVHVRPPGWSPAVWVDDGDDPQDGPAEVVWLTDDPALLALIDRGSRAPDDDAFERFLERYEPELLGARPIVGSISADTSGRELRELLDLQGERVSRPWVIDGTSRSKGLRATGLVLFTLALLGIAVLVSLQRRWVRRRLALSGKAAPTRF